jgi:RNA polymerase sigma-70 factor (ECF subfamily)
MSLKSDDISRLYANHAKDLLRFFLRRSLQVEVAMDLVAETFAKSFVHRADFRGEGERAEVAWVFGIARNELSEYFRRGLVERRALQKLGLELGQPTDEDFDRVEELAGLQRQRAAMAAGLDDLPRVNREAVRLRVVEERSYAEMASTLGITEQTARARVSRGLRTLAKTTRALGEAADLG